MNTVQQVKLHDFNAATLTRERFGPVHAFQMGDPVHKDWEKLSNGNILVRNFRVFKAGTFKDSMGEQRTWEREHLESMQFNFGLLKNSGRLTDIPVRDGHLSLFGNGGEVIGWHEDVRHVDGFIDVDFLITDDEAKRKWENGTFRARSSEVGYYETNDEALYYPVYLGFAFVDIGAVEGLYEAAKQDPEKFTILVDKETTVGTKAAQHSSSTPPPEGQTPEGGTPEEEENTPEGGEGTPAATPAPGTQETPPAATPAPGTENTPTPESGAHSAAPGGFQFRVNGQPTNDFAAVQNHITAMETSLNEIEQTARADFVTSLAHQNLIPATGLESAIAFAKSLTAAQFESYKKQFGDAEALPLLGNHGNSITNPDGQPSTEDDQVEIDTEVVAQFKRSNLAPDKIRKTDAYKRLEAAGKAPAL